jgi:hypothetical protein
VVTKRNIGILAIAAGLPIRAITPEGDDALLAEVIL